VRDARPFLAFHLRRRAEERADSNRADLHRLARWVENLPARDPNMARIEATPALGYDDGSFTGGDEAEDLIRSYVVDFDLEARRRWLGRFADAVVRFWE
jgi:hypothetical protein